MKERIKAIHELAKKPMVNDRDVRRVEIIVLKFHEDSKVIDECLSRVVNHTKWPFKLNVYDNRMNTANTSKIWNKLISESTCGYVCLLDSDAFVPTGIEPCWLTRMMESIDDKGVVVAMGPPHIGGANKATVAAPYPSARPQEGVWSGFCVLYNRDIFDQVGRFDEDFYLYGQDSEFAYRLLKKTGGGTYRMDVFVNHLGSHSAKKADGNGLDREADKIYSRELFKIRTGQ